MTEEADRYNQFLAGLLGRTYTFKTLLEERKTKPIYFSSDFVLSH